MSGSRDDFDSLDDMRNHHASSGDAIDAIPSEFASLHRRILSDSAAWRAGLPGIAALEEQVAALSAHPRESRSPTMRTYSTRENPLMLDRPDTHDLPETAKPGAGTTRPHTRQRLDPVPPGRSPLRNLLAAGAVVALIALFVVVFAVLPHSGNTSHNIGPGHGTAVPATPTPGSVRSNKWQPVAGLTNTPGVPVIAPGNPNVVYEAASGKLRRSDDSGKTWSDLPIPTDFPAGDTYQWLDLFVSPLDAHTVWATANLVNPNNPTSCPFATPFAFTGGNALYGGSVPCQVQHVSTDGGKTWELVKPSFGFMLGTNSADMIAGNGYYQYSAAPQAQGSRLYTMTDNGPLAASATAAQLAMSEDGGKTWSDASAALTGAGQRYLCSFAATPTGATVFAVTSGAGCGPDYSNSAQTLWRSDDAGANWRQVTLPANRIVLSLVATTAGGHSVVYAAMPSLSGNSHAGVTEAAPADIFASTNGGASWQTAPSAGVPSGAVTAGPLIGLSNGDVVQAFYVQPAQPSTDGKNTFVFARWHAGIVSWHELSRLNLYGISQLLDLAGPSGGDTLWLSTPDGFNPGSITYSVQTSTP